MLTVFVAIVAQYNANESSCLQVCDDNFEEGCDWLTLQNMAPFTWDPIVVQRPSHLAVDMRGEVDTGAE